MNNQLFCTTGRLIADRARLYEACGLDNIWLVDGFSLIQRDGESMMLVEDREGLHKAIALHLIRFRKALSGREIRFIRRAIDMTQAELAHRLGTGAQTVARWEKDQVNIPAPEDRLLRITAILAVTEPSKFAQMILEMPKNLQELDEGPNRPIRFTHDNHWIEAELEAA